MQLKDYSGSETIVRICFSDDTVESNRLAGRNVLIVKGKSAILECKGSIYEYPVTGECEFCDNDTVFINVKGICRLMFSFKEYSQTIIVTNKCNSNCIMCPYTSSFRRRAGFTDSDFLCEQVRYLPDHTEHLVITGGEPTLADMSFFNLMMQIRMKFPHINCLLLTNGRSFSIESICKNAVDLFPRKIIAAIPLHASYPELHDSITQSPGSFRQTIAGIKRLLAIGIAVEIRIVVFKLNHNDIRRIAELIRTELHAVSVVNFMAAEMCGNAAINSNDVWISYNQGFANCEEAIDLLVNSGIDVGIYNFPLCSVPQKYIGLYRKSISNYKVRYGQACSDCSEQQLCGGVFASSLKFAESDMIPFTENP